MDHPSTPRPAALLGLAGIAPQALCLAAVLVLPEWRWVALAAGCFYAALILSFLGGMWWMLALARGEASAAPYALGAAASLAGWALLVPWCLGWAWPAPSLLLLGGVLLASPLADRALSRTLAVPPGWLRLRVAMASALGALTLLLGLAAL